MYLDEFYGLKSIEVTVLVCSQWFNKGHILQQHALLPVKEIISTGWQQSFIVERELLPSLRAYRQSSWYRILLENMRRSDAQCKIYYGIRPGHRENAAVQLKTWSRAMSWAPEWNIWLDHEIVSYMSKDSLKYGISRERFHFTTNRTVNKAWPTRCCSLLALTPGKAK